MLDIVKNSQNHNGNGSDAIGGRGLLRRKLTPEQRAHLAADVAMGLVHVTPSLKQAADTVGVPMAKLRAELKSRAAQRIWDQWLDEVERQELERLQVQTEAETINDQADAIVRAWFAAHPDANELAVRLLGPTSVWDVLARVVA
jgi:RPA family protein